MSSSLADPQFPTVIVAVLVGVALGLLWSGLFYDLLTRRRRELRQASQMVDHILQASQTGRYPSAI